MRGVDREPRDELRTTKVHTDTLYQTTPSGDTNAVLLRAHYSTAVSNDAKPGGSIGLQTQFQSALKGDNEQDGHST